MKKKDPLKYGYCSANEDICPILDLLYLISDKIGTKSERCGSRARNQEVLARIPVSMPCKKLAGPPKLSYSANRSSN
eukprot:scaffold429439_cov59-Attheya_sp.AAC.1